MNYGEVRGSAETLAAFEEPFELPVPKLPTRVNLEPDKIEKGITQLVLSLVEFVRQLMEKQALRRIESGGLTELQVERLGTTLMRLEGQMKQLQTHFGIESLNLDLGPLGNLLDK